MSVKAGKKIVENLKKTAPSELLGKPIEEVKDYDGIKFILKDKAWLLIRQSGTEPILRIYAESASNKEVMTLLNTGKRLALKWNKVE